MVCPKGKCLREVNGLPLRPDGVHFDVLAAADLGREVLSLIDPANQSAAPAASVAIQP
jgi:hypothetical protein